MRPILLILIFMAAPPPAQETGVEVVGGIRLIDATKLSVAELLALAEAKRENATHASCCDWGGGCQPELARAAMGVGETLSRLAAGE